MDILNLALDMKKSPEKYAEILKGKKLYTLFEKALYAHNNGEDCEAFNDEFEYDKMQDEILPKLASKVMKILNKN